MPERLAVPSTLSVVWRSTSFASKVSATSPMDIEPHRHSQTGAWHGWAFVRALTSPRHTRGLLDRLHDEYSPLNDLEDLSEYPWYDDDGNDGSER